MDDLAAVFGAVDASPAAEGTEGTEAGKEAEGTEGTEAGKAAEGTEGTEAGKAAEGTEGTEAGKAAEGTEADKGKEHHSRFQQRIDALVRNNYELKRENERLKNSSPVDSFEPPPRPDPKNYTDQRTFDRDVGKWEATVEALEARKTEHIQRKVADAVSRFTKSVSDGKAEFPDFETVTAPIMRMDIDLTTIDETFGALDNPAEVLYFLGKNPAKMYEIMSLPLTGQVRELAILSRSIRDYRSKQKKVSGAPAPANKPKGSGKAGAGTIDLNNCSMEEYVKARKKQQNRE